jgi:23S rRNA (cytosine1962-C5)-methyltransferase
MGKYGEFKHDKRRPGPQDAPPHPRLRRIVAHGPHRPKKEPRLTVSVEGAVTPRVRCVWIYDNMVGEVGGELIDGGTVFLYDRNQKFLGSAIYNANSRIRARLFSLEKEFFDDAYIERAIAAALLRRQRVFDMADSFRVVFSDADFLPGLIIDKLGSVLVVQLLTAAADCRIDAVLGVLKRLVWPQGIVVRADAPVRAREGLPIREPRVEGVVPPTLQIEQDGFTVFADPLAGQKTGLFLDQRFNRRLIAPWCPGRRVLDLFCYVGAWSFTAARAGAAAIIGVDSSAPALELARLGATHNEFSQITFECSDVFDYVTAATNRAEKFEVVVADPPAFAKMRKQVPDALRAYLSLNYRAMKLLPVGGVLASSSCSQHVTQQEFDETLEKAARNARMQFHVAARGAQAPDHPVLLGFPESEYLKCSVLVRVQ